MIKMDFYTEKHIFPRQQSRQNYQLGNCLDHIFPAEKSNKYASGFNFKYKIITSGSIKI